VGLLRLIRSYSNIVDNVHVSEISTNVRGSPFSVAIYEAARRGEPDATLAAAFVSCMFVSIAAHAAPALVGHNVFQQSCSQPAIEPKEPIY